MFTLNKKLPLHCRLTQQISDSEKAEDMSADSLKLACRIWIAIENNVRHGWQFYFR